MLQQIDITIDYVRVVCQQLINVQEKHFIAFTWIWISDVYKNPKKQAFGLFHKTIVVMKDMSGAKQSRVSRTI